MFILKFHDNGGVPSPSGRRGSTMASERGTIHIIEDIIDTNPPAFISRTVMEKVISYGD